MRAIAAVSMSFGALVAGLLAACGGSPPNGYELGDGGAGSSSGGGSGGSSGGHGGSGSGSASGSGSGSSSGSLAGDGSTAPVPDAGTTITVYAHTDDTLYSVDPMTKAITLIGPFTGTSDASTDSAVTDLAVNAAGDVYVNTESIVYQAALPAAGGGAVALTKVAAIQGSARFYALAFAPAGALDSSNEILVGGDSSGSLWSIDTSSGATKNLGNFGADPTISGNTYELSGDIVFYDDAMGTPTGLATIRSCPAGSATASKCKGDFLASVDMTALATAHTMGTPAASLLGAIYGATGPSAPGNGTGYEDVFGLGVWNATVFGFTRHAGTSAPALITIDTTTGAGTMVSNAFTFDNGWSGAGVTTKVVVSVPPPMNQ